MPLAVRDLFASPSRWGVPTVLEYEGRTALDDGEEELGEGFEALELPRERRVVYEIGDLGVPLVDRTAHGLLRGLLTHLRGKLLQPIAAPPPPPIPPREATVDVETIAWMPERTRQQAFRALAWLCPRMPEELLRGLVLGWQYSQPAWAEWTRQIMLARGWTPPEPWSVQGRIRNWIEEPTTWRAETGVTPSEVSAQLAALDRRIRNLASVIASNWWAMPEAARPSWTAFLQGYGGFVNWTRSAGPKSFGRRETLANLRAYQGSLAAWERYWDAMFLPRAPRYLPVTTSGFIPGIPFI